MLAEIETLGVTIGVIVKLSALLVADCTIAQGALDVNRHVITSPCTIELDE